MRYILHFAIVLSFLYSGPLMARNPVLLPLPQKYVRTNASFHPKEIAVSSEGKLRSILMEFLEELPVSVQPDSRYKIEVSLVDKLDGIPLNSEEAYQLSVSSRGITIRAVSEQGAYWAIQTLRQLTERQGKRYSIQGCEITDWPAFRIRGFMQDVGRSYISMKELKREIEVLSRQDERISLASHGEPSLASGEQDLSDAERQLQYEPYARKILHDRGGKGAGSLL